MLLSEIRSSIINTAKGGGIPSDDARLSGRLVDFWIRNYRAAIIAEATAFGKNFMPDLVQDLGCLTLTEVDKGECSDVAWGCKIKKTTLPSLLDLPGERALTYVGLIDKQSPFEVVTSEQAGLMRYRMITNTKIRAYRIGDTLYIMSPINKRLKYVNVRGIFEKPEEVTTTSLTGEIVCFNSGTDKYPIPDILMPKLIENILSKELKLISSVIDDEMNDARDTSKLVYPKYRQPKYATQKARAK